MKLWKDICQYVLAVLIVGCFMTALVLVILTEPKDDAVMNTLVGALGAVFVMVATYFYGSSKGSADKNEMIKNGN